MKSRFIILFALVMFALGANAEGYTSPFGNSEGSIGVVSTASYQEAGFNSMMIYENNYTNTITFGDLSEIGAPSPIVINGRSLAGPPIIPGGEENNPGNVETGIKDSDGPIGDGTWALLACAMLFVVFRMVLSKRAKATEL